MRPSSTKRLDELWKSIGRMDINPGAEAAQEDLAAGLPVYGHKDGLAPGEIIKEYPDGHKEIVRLERGTRKEIFIRALSCNATP